MRIRIHGIRDKTFPSPVPQPNEKLKTGSLTKNRAADEELTNVQTASSAALKSIFRFLLFLRPLHSHRSGFIPYSVKVASDRKFFCDSVLKYPGSVRQTITRECVGKGDGIRTTERLCLLVCIISAGSGCVKAAQHPKGKALTRPDLCRL